MYYIRLDETSLLSPPPALQIPQWADYTSASAPVIGKPIQTPQGRLGHAAVAVGTKVCTGIIMCACMHARAHVAVRSVSVAYSLKVTFVYTCQWIATIGYSWNRPMSVLLLQGYAHVRSISYNLNTCYKSILREGCKVSLITTSSSSCQ